MNLLKLFVSSKRMKIWSSRNRF